ncbi:diguanylate cyclase [Undibacterium amnicola]|uniref:Diguanylate cyclase n=1 Tax=Undibacterium amnicola TaxID=1834038 RepID=A0ABR6XW85_9BURK|nr:diguanylate cyclase [Undibacterium amnicola]MBC3833706.1 diguanylate cyclase [Undibacterium amnicola]
MNKQMLSLANFTEDNLRAILQALPALIWLKDADGVYLACNERFEQFFGALEKDIIGRTDYDFVSKELADSFRAHDLLAMQKGGLNINEEWISFANDGHRELVETSKTPLHNADGKLIGILGISHDITKRKQLEKYEKFRSSTLELLAKNIPLPSVLEAIVRGVEQLHTNIMCSILLLDKEGKHLVDCVAPSLPSFYNQAINGIAIGLGVGSCGTAAFLGQRVVVDDIASHAYWVPYAELAAQAGLGACWSQPILSSELRVLGTFAIYHPEKNALADLDVYIIEQSAQLASIAIERKRIELKVQHMAFHDALTGLPNRSLLYDRLEQTKAACKRHHRFAAVLFIDLDNFKPLNDEYGHSAGDLLLQEVAQRLSLCVREVDTVARFGGDEFVVILSDLDAEPAQAEQLACSIAEKIRASLSAPYQINIPNAHEKTSIQHHCTASIGVVLLRHLQNHDIDIVKLADQAMYQAKATGRNKIYFLDSKP